MSDITEDDFWDILSFEIITEPKIGVYGIRDYLFANLRHNKNLYAPLTINTTDKCIKIMKILLNRIEFLESYTVTYHSDTKKIHVHYSGLTNYNNSKSPLISTCFAIVINNKPKDDKNDQ